MADLRGPSDRGQLLVITGISIALLLVLLALALNTAVFGEVHVPSTDDNVQEERTVVQYQDSAERGVAPLISPVNDDADTPEALEDALADEIAAWNQTASDPYAGDGVVVRTSLAEPHFEVDVTHKSGDFTNASDAPNWGVVEDLTSIDEYEMTANDDELVQTNESASLGTSFNLSVAGGSGNEWVMTVYESNDNQDIIVRTDGSDNTKCSVDDQTNVTIDFVDSNIEECADDDFISFLEDPALEAPYTVEHSNGDNASGAYDIVADGEFDSDDYYAEGSGSSPRFSPTVVAADVKVEYRSADVNYQTVIRVDPGENNE